MLDRLFNARVHDFLHLLGLIGIAAGMSLGKAFMSMAMLLIIANFLLEAKFKFAVQRIKSNRLLIFTIGFFLLIIIGLFWTNDFSVGLKEIKSRLPFLAIPLIIGARESLSRKQLLLLFRFFLASLLVTSVYNYLSYNGIIGNHVYDDIRGMSMFGSHIRYGIVIAIGAGLCIHQQIESKKFLLIYCVIALWFMYYTYFSEILTGALSMIMIFVATAVYLLWRWKKWLAIATKLIVTAIAVSFLFYFLNFKVATVEPDTLPLYTVNGNKYLHSNMGFSEINGQPLFSYYSEKEMLKEWNKVSDLDYMGNDLNDHILRNTAVRYMTAMELTKDSVGFQQLTPSDIRAIEKGYTYPGEPTDHFFSRLYGIRYQLINKTNPNGHSLLQRFEYWKTSVHVIKNHWFIGVGTGGNQQALNKAYDELDSKLLPQNRCRSHNMYLSYFISYGIVGFIAFLGLLITILHYSFRTRYLLGIQFLSVLAASFLIEDTLETQMGVTIFGFFLGLVINEMNLKKEIISDSELQIAD